jgi:diguanylate cyclase (GGDEF)-like protein/PAS domain S-box-containing protein
VRYVSPAVERLLGYEAADLVRTAVAELIHPEDLPRAAQMFSERLVTDGVGLPEVHRLRHRDGSWRYIETIATNLIHNASVRGIVLNSHDITERTNLEAKLARQAHYDALTGLPNRVLFIERAQQMLDRPEPRQGADALLYLDLDGLKRINDTLGHSAGDALLVAAARRLADTVRPEDLVSRFGGDEFVILLRDAGDEGTARTIAGQIIAAMRRPIALGGHTVRVSASIGIAMVRGGDTPVESPLRDADVALYRAKAAGKNQAIVFHAEADGRSLNGRALAAGVRPRGGSHSFPGA